MKVKEEGKERMKEEDVLRAKLGSRSSMELTR